MVRNSFSNSSKEYGLPAFAANSRAHSSIPGVRMGPGLTAFEVTPVPASAFARLTVRLTFALLVAEYAAISGNGRDATPLAIAMTRPHPLSFMPGTKWFVIRTIEPTF